MQLILVAQEVTHHSTDTNTTHTNTTTFLETIPAVTFVLNISWCRIFMHVITSVILIGDWRCVVCIVSVVFFLINMYFELEMSQDPVQTQVKSSVHIVEYKLEQSVFRNISF